MSKSSIIYISILFIFMIIAFLGGIIGKRSLKIDQKINTGLELKCAYDGTKIKPIYQVTAYLNDSTIRNFCSVYCAMKWLENNSDKTMYFTVIDETTGQNFDSSLAYFVESSLITVHEVNNRIHVFASKDDAITHAKFYNGKIIENPLDNNFVPPMITQLDSLKIGIPLLPDALPLQFAVFKPIFKENRLNITLVPFHSEEQGVHLFKKKDIDGIVIDLPTAIFLSNTKPFARIIKNILRSNPYRAIFAIVCLTKNKNCKLKNKTIAIPKGLNFNFYAEFFLKQLNILYDEVILKKVKSTKQAYELLNKGQVFAALLRSPYTEMVMADNNMELLVDDRTLPWMSVLIIKQKIIENKFESIKKLLFGLEQSVLALNLKEDEYRGFLKDYGSIPQKAKNSYPMPVFEGFNAPSKEELDPIVKWLVKKQLLKNNIDYKMIVNSNFLPNPEDVGLAFCCQ